MKAAAHLVAVPSPSRALEALFHQHHDLVFRVAYRITGNAADAEDVLQTVFVRLLQRDDVPDLTAGASTYFRRAAVNAALDIMRRKRTRMALPGQAELRMVVDAPAEPPAPDAPQPAEELETHLREALSELHPRTAEMFVLRYLEGVENGVIAELLGTSSAVVAVTLFRARRQLQKKLASVAGGAA